MNPRKSFSGLARRAREYIDIRQSETLKLPLNRTGIMTETPVQFKIGDEVEVTAGPYRGCTGKVTKLTKIQMEIMMETGVKHPLMEPVVGSLRRVNQSNALLLNRPDTPRRFPRVSPDTDIWSLNAQSIATRREMRADAERIQNQMRQLIVALDHLELIETMRASPNRNNDDDPVRRNETIAVQHARRRRRR